MSLTRSIARNTIYQLIGRGVGVFLGLVGLAMMTRYLGQEGFGQYTIVMSFLTFFGIVADLGLLLVTIQLLSQPEVGDKGIPTGACPAFCCGVGMTKETGVIKDKGIASPPVGGLAMTVEKVMGNIFTFRLVSAVVILALAPLVALFFPYATIIKQGILLTSLAFLFNALIQVQTGFCQKFLRMAWSALGEALGRVFFVAVIGIVILTKGGLLAMLSAAIVCNFVYWLTVFLFNNRLVLIRLHFDWPIWRDIWRRSWPIAISILFNLVYLKTDIIILSVVRSEAEVGLYGAAYRVVDVLTTLPILFVGLILPILTSAWLQKNYQYFRSGLQKSFDCLAILAIPLAAGTWLLANPLMSFVAGRDFALSGEPLKILGLAVAAIFVGSIFTHSIIALEKQKQMVWAYCLTAALTFGIYFLAIPRYGYYGAAWGTVFSEVFIAILAFLAVRHYSNFTPRLSILPKIFIATAGMLLFLYFFSHWHILILAGLGTTIYFGLLYLFRGFSKELIFEIIAWKKQ